MRRNERQWNEASSSSPSSSELLEKLHKEVSSIATCTPKTLELAKALFAPPSFSQDSDATKTRRKPINTSRSRGPATVTKVKNLADISCASPRDAQRITKACLLGLKPAEVKVPAGETDGFQSLGSKANAKGRKTVEIERGHILGDICSMAVQAWSICLVSDDNASVLLIAKARYNLAARLLDLNLLPSALNSLQAFHLTITGKYEPSQEISETPGRIAPLLIIPRIGLCVNEAALILGFCTLVLRYALATDNTFEQQIIGALVHQDGFLTWIDHLAKTDADQASKFLTHLNRQLFKYASRAAPETQVEAQITILDSMLLETARDVEHIVLCFCRMLDHSCSMLTYQRAETLATKLISALADCSHLGDDSKLLLLIDRMSRLSQALGLTKEAEMWLQKGIDRAEPNDTLIAVRLDHCTLTLKSAEDGPSCTNILSTFEGEVKETFKTKLPHEREAALVLKSIGSLRQQIARSAKQFPHIALVCQSSLCCLAELLKSILWAVKPNTLKVYKMTSTGIVASWLAFTSQEDVPASYHEQVLILFSLVQHANLESDLQLLSVSVYNTAGKLYNQGDYQQAAILLELYFQWQAPTSESARQINYVWSAYARCDEYGKAAEWLRRMVDLMSPGLTSHTIEMINSTAQMHPEIYRQITRFTHMVLQKSLDMSILPEGPLAEHSGPVLELQLYYLSTQRNIEAAYSALFESTLRRVLSHYATLGRQSAHCRVLCDALAYLWQLHDLARIKSFLDISDDSSVVDGDPAASLLQQLFTVRLSVFKLLAQAKENRKPHLFVESLRQIIAHIGADISPAMQTLLAHLFKESQDILEYLQYPISAIQVTEQLLSLNEKEKFLDRSELLQSLIWLSGMYLYLGYDERAGSVLKKANKLSNEHTSQETLLQLTITSINHSLVLSKSDVSQELTLMCRLVKMLSKEYDLRGKALICLAHYAESVGALGQAIHISMEALSVMRKALILGSQAYDTIRPSSSTLLETSLADLCINPDHDVPKHGSSTILLAVLTDLGRMHEKGGMIKEAIFYRNEALMVASHLDLPDLICSARLALGITRQRSGQSVELVPLDLLESQNAFHLAECYVMSAELLRQSEPIMSLEFGLRAKGKIREAMDCSRKFQKDSKPITPIISRSRANPKHASKTSNGSASSDFNGRLCALSQTVLCFLTKLFRDTGKEDEAQTCLAELQMLTDHGSLEAHGFLLLASEVLRMTEVHLQADPVYGVLQDSALCLPSVCVMTHATEQVTKARCRVGQQHRAKDTTNSTAQSLQALDYARSKLAENFETWLATGDSRAAYTCGSLFNIMNLTCSALLQSPQAGLPKPLSSTYLLETSRAIALRREKENLDAEILARSKSSWLDNVQAIVPAIRSSRSEFQTDHIDIVPQEWIVVSIGLSPSGQDLVLSRMQTHKTPFILRLPMSRHASRDVDEETFNYEDAKSEMLAIVQQSNDSAHKASSIKSQSGKAEWWALRQELDTRLKTLLDNIERCWLGGFRGLFGHSNSDSSETAAFHNTFARIVAKHVPLRKQRYFDLDVRVLDLFLDLGVIDDETSLEILEDLLYFVLDIYQFHGESIAYDEIDIDQMVVDVQTALKKYHDRFSSEDYDTHIILVLDKSVQMFPWESMPCLRCKSTSRVPSLTILKDLLNRYNEGSISSIERSSGSFILNPGQDLPSTERTFKRLFEALPQWSGIVGRKPEQSEIIAMLESSPIFIYFGHGGGEQYIRPSKLKKLNSCGVVVLMGCSSGALKEQGIHDPWGTPYDYLVSGCPSLVANLWDVTDKDIDRFSIKMLSHWSLTSDLRESTSLGRAVASSRDECVLPYLNGAAPVLYGLPARLAPKT